MSTVAILGGGAWGTALAAVAARAGNRAVLWARDAGTAEAVTTHHENPAYLPGIALDPAIRATTALNEAAASADAIVLAVPAQSLRGVAEAVAEHVRDGTPVIVAAKGLERGSGKRMTEVVAAAIPAAIPAVLSGPSFASDVARGLPTAVTVAAADETLALALCRMLVGPAFRPYAETDVIGVEVGGAVKNVLAIAAGIVAGRKLGTSAHAALVARGFAELRRLAEAIGARPETVMGLSGLGDLVLTCSGTQSRNFAYGETVGAGGSRSDSRRLVEGIATAPVARDLARRTGVEAPIVEAVAAILEGTLGIDAAIDSLMSRPLKRETA